MPILDADAAQESQDELIHNAAFAGAVMVEPAAVNLYQRGLEGLVADIEALLPAGKRGVRQLPNRVRVSADSRRYAVSRSQGVGDRSEVTLYVPHENGALTLEVETQSDGRAARVKTDVWFDSHGKLKASDARHQPLVDEAQRLVESVAHHAVDQRELEAAPELPRQMIDQVREHLAPLDEPVSPPAVAKSAAPEHGI